nr:MAG: hypothetical protein J07AB56_00530 [Candidatus Nanosalinarum sp. J07AB56]
MIYAVECSFVVFSVFYIRKTVIRHEYDGVEPLFFGLLLDFRSHLVHFAIRFLYLIHLFDLPEPMMNVVGLVKMCHNETGLAFQRIEELLFFSP